MAKARRTTTPEKETEVRVNIPAALVESFAKEPRIVFKYHPAGLWPVDIRTLQRTDVLKRLAADKAFNRDFEIVIMPRQ